MIAEPDMYKDILDLMNEADKDRANEYLNEQARTEKYEALAFVSDTYLVATTNYSAKIEELQLAARNNCDVGEYVLMWQQIGEAMRLKDLMRLPDSLEGHKDSVEAIMAFLYTKNTTYTKDIPYYKDDKGGYGFMDMGWKEVEKEGLTGRLANPFRTN
jgi:hypothetical protein